MDTDAKLIAALAAAVASVLAASLSAAIAIATQRMSRSTQQRVETLRAELAQHARERDAARDYEYTARKRLYAECEPILFRFSEACDAARRRITRMAEPKASGLRLEPDGSDRLATFYRITAPLVEFAILRERLTAFDLGLDRRIYARYLLGRVLLETISDDVQLAGEEPRYAYVPGGKPGFLGRADPAIYLRQGIPPEDLEQMVEAMMSGPPQSLRVISFASFRQSARAKGAVKDVCLRLAPLVQSFEPTTRPILWRILSVQHAILTLISRIGPDPRGAELIWADSLMPPSTGDPKLDAETLKACRNYLSPRLERLVASVEGSSQGEVTA